MTVLIVVTGGLGALARYELSGWAQRRLDTTRPWGTILVNLCGTVLLAAIIAGWRVGLLDDGLLVVIAGGFAAGFTTFSTWMVEVARAAEGGTVGRRRAALDALGQGVVGLAAAAALLAMA